MITNPITLKDIVIATKHDYTKSDKMIDDQKIRISKWK